MANEHNPGSTDGDPFSAWRDLDPAAMSAGFEDAARAFYEVLGRSSASAEELSSAVDDVLKDQNSVRVVELMSRAYMTWANHGLRYWSTLAERHGTYVTNLMNRMNTIRSNPEASEVERRALLDEAEQYLREVADMSLHEGRVLKREMESLSAELRKGFTEPNPDGEPRRYGGVKP